MAMTTSTRKRVSRGSRASIANSSHLSLVRCANVAARTRSGNGSHGTLTAFPRPPARPRCLRTPPLAAHVTHGVPHLVRAHRDLEPFARSGCSVFIGRIVATEPFRPNNLPLLASPHARRPAELIAGPRQPRCCPARVRHHLIAGSGSVCSLATGNLPNLATEPAQDFDKLGDAIPPRLRGFAGVAGQKQPLHRNNSTRSGHLTGTIR